MIFIVAFYLFKLFIPEIVITVLQHIFIHVTTYLYGYFLGSVVFYVLKGNLQQK